jgi:tRNA/rRNA methyltransferase
MPEGDNTGFPAACPLSAVPMKTRFVLIHTSHAGNVGAAARAMKTMGFDDLVLVEPRWPDVLRREETLQRSSGAADVLARARTVATLDEALDGMTHLCATAMTPRDFGPPTRSPRAHLPALAAGADGAGGEDGVGGEEGVAFLFGSERFGMRNEDVYRCDVALRIPTDPAFGSLNLGAAIQVIAYEWRTALGGFDAPAAAGVRTADAGPRRADAQELAGMLGHWESALADIGFLDPAAPKKLMPRLRQLFGRARPTQEEIHILRGIAKAMSLTAKQPRP